MNSKEFARRRKQLMRMVGQGGIVILPAAPVRTRSRDTEYIFRQDSDFYYLTGFAEPDAVAALVPGRESGEFVVFCRERDRDREIWDGHREGPEGVVSNYGADDAFPIDDIDDILPGLMEPCSRVYYTMGMYSDFDARVADWVNSLRSGLSKGMHTPHEFVALDHLLHDMRLFKSRAEISAMRRSAKVAVAAHKRAMQLTRPGLYEYEIEAEFRHEFRRNNAWVSYSPIVGSGANACILHYVDNNKELKDGDLLLIDAGCELDYYASDITRTFPVNGRFSPEQRAVYDIVLDAQLAAAISSFREAMIELGEWNNVVVFTASDFGRTTIDNGNGTDHGWGGHHFVAGGSVQGKRLYGDIPFADVDSNDFTKSRGRLIPTTSVEQYAATMGSWFGLDNSELQSALPNLRNFNTSDIGFMGTAST